MNKLRLVYNDNHIELAVTGFQFPHEGWLMLQGSWSIDGREMSGQDPSVELCDIISLSEDLKRFLADAIDRVEGYFIEPDFSIFVDKEHIEIYFLPESTIWNRYPRPEAEKIIYGKIPTFIEPYNEQDAKALLAWAEAVISDMNSMDIPKEQE